MKKEVTFFSCRTYTFSGTGDSNLEYCFFWNTRFINHVRFLSFEKGEKAAFPHEVSQSL